MGAATPSRSGSGLSGERTLNFVHLELPHVPYEFYPDGRRYAGGLLQTDGLRDGQGRTPDDETISRLWNSGCCCRSVSPTRCWAG